MSGWSGFSDAEIERFQKLTKGASPSESPSSSDSVPPRRDPASRSVKPRANAKPQHKNASTPVDGPGNGQRSDVTAASIPLPESCPSDRSPSVVSREERSTPTDTPSQPPSDAIAGAPVSVGSPSPPGDEVRVLSPQSDPVDECVPSPEHSPPDDETDERLIQLQKRQKLMEEQNKRKKATIMKAIQERKQRADAESVKARKLQVQLSSLEMAVTTDVELLRSKIEEASRLLCEAQRRYERAEKEWVSAKENLFRKKEQKELLSEHLYTILHNHEQRKADKLQQMMAELQLSEEEAVQCT